MGVITPLNIGIWVIGFVLFLTGVIGFLFGERVLYPTYYTVTKQDVSTITPMQGTCIENCKNIDNGKSPKPIYKDNKYTVTVTYELNQGKIKSTRKISSFTETDLPTNESIGTGPYNMLNHNGYLFGPILETFDEHCFESYHINNYFLTTMVGIGFICLPFLCMSVQLLVEHRTGKKYGLFLELKNR